MSRRRSYEPAADLQGRPTSVGTYRRNGRTIAIHAVTEDEKPHIEVDESRLPELRRRVSKRLAQYRASGEFSPIEVAVLEGMFSGKSQAQVAREVGRSRERVRQICNAIAPRAPLFKRLLRFGRRPWAKP